MQKFSLTRDVGSRRDVEDASHSVQSEVSIKNDETSFFEVRSTLFYQLRIDRVEGFHFADAEVTLTIDVHYHREPDNISELLNTFFQIEFVKLEEM